MSMRGIGFWWVFQREKYHEQALKVKRKKKKKKTYCSTMAASGLGLCRQRRWQHLYSDYWKQHSQELEAALEIAPHLFLKKDLDNLPKTSASASHMRTAALCHCLYRWFTRTGRWEREKCWGVWGLGFIRVRRWKRGKCWGFGVLGFREMLRV